MQDQSGDKMSWRGIALRVPVHAVALLLAVFLVFVGYHKAFSSLVELAKHGAWTVHLPELLGRIVGWSEMACAIALAAPLLTARARVARRIACLYFILNQFAAAATHAVHGETSALPQNGMLILLCLFILWGDMRSPEPYCFQ